MSDIRVGITNQKGGVSKTTNAINIAGALADRGHDILAADLDPQGYLTNRLGKREAYMSGAPTLLDALKEPRETHLEELVVTHAEFDVLPSNVDMFQAVQDLIASGWKPRERLRLLFDHGGADAYDFVIVDAPPSLGPLNDNVLLATQQILIPVETDEVMRLALEHLLNQIETLEKRYETSIRERGLVVSDIHYPLDNEQREMIEWFESWGEHVPVFEVAHRVAIARSIKREGSIFGADAEQTDQQEAYEEIAEVLEADV